MKKRFIAMLAVILSLSLTLAGCEKKPADAVATVNGEYITVEEIQPIYNMIKTQYGGDQMFNPDSEEGKQMIHNAKLQATQTIINNKVMAKMAEEYGIKADDAEIDKKLEEIKTQLGGEDVFNQMIEQDGLTVEELKENIKEQIIGEQLNDKLMEKYAPSDEEIEKALADKKYTQYNASHILIKTTNETGEKLTGEEKEAKKAEIEAILKEINDGGDFTAIAKEKSEDGSKEQGGELGNFQADTMVKPFADALKKLDVDQVSGVVESEFGYHIIKLNSKEEDPAKYDEEYKNKIIEEIKMTAVQEGAQKEIEKTKKELKVKIYKDSEGLNSDATEDNKPEETKDTQDKTEETKENSEEKSEEVKTDKTEEKVEEK